MGLPQLETCCCFFDLKTGNTILGVLNALLSFVMFIMLIVIAAMVGSMQSSKLMEEDPDAEAAITGLYVICIILVLMYLIKFLSDLLFIYAVMTGHSGIIKIYLIVWIAFFLMSSFLFFLHVLDFHAWTIVSQLIYMGISVYTILVAHSYYKQLNTREEL